MKARELRQKSIEELVNGEGDLREQLFKLRFQKATGQIQNHSKIRMVRKDLARLLTIRAERLREAE
jgi:large subunit ribosomal protein L29